MGEKMLVIGLTGGIASGKSTVSKVLREMGLPIFDADESSRQAVRKGSRGLALVVEAFGEEYLNEDGEMNRPKIAELVFKDKEALHTLEAIIHKVVWQEAEEFLAEHKDKKAVVLDVPLLIECGWHLKVDQVWLVAVDPETQIIRAMARSGMTRQEVVARIRAQMSLEEKLTYADFVIDNSGELEKTIKLVKTKVKNLLGE